MLSQVKPSSFITKFYSILQNRNFQQIIKLDQQSSRIIIFEKEKFEVEILPFFFRHNKFSSFIRQLNLYGFKKIKSVGFLCFSHPVLMRKQSFLSIMAKKKLKENDDQEAEDNNSRLNNTQQVALEARLVQDQQFKMRQVQNIQNDLNLLRMAQYQQIMAMNLATYSNFYCPPWQWSNNLMNRQNVVYYIPAPSISSQNQGIRYPNQF